MQIFNIHQQPAGMAVPKCTINRQLHRASEPFSQQIYLFWGKVWTMLLISIIAVALSFNSCRN